MSSFHKLSETFSINGTRNKNSALLVSSGIPSLDHIIGGGLPTGAIFMLEEDVLGNYCRVMSKYFVAEGVVSKHDLFLASADEDPHDIVKELPLPTVNSQEDEIKSAASNIDKMQIAWRYEDLGQVESSFGTNTGFGHHFDLSKHIDQDTIKDTNISYWTPNNTGASAHGFRNEEYLNLLQAIKEISRREEYQRNYKGKNNILRINIMSLGSPVWMSQDCGEDVEPCAWGRDLIKFLYCLRVIISDTNAIAFITVPSHLFDDECLVKRLYYSVDNAVKLESFAGSSRETNPVFKDYNGLFHITKISAINSLVPYMPPSRDMAFKLRRKKFIIEKLHLPPELQDSSEREQDDITATPVACGGFKKKDIDF